jgi:hypothetical protein
MAAGDGSPRGGRRGRRPRHQWSALRRPRHSTPGSPLTAALPLPARADTGEGNTWIWVTAGKLLQPFFRLIGGKHRIWPPSKQSAPLIILGWCLLTSPLWFLMRERRNRDVEMVEERRRECACRGAPARAD